MPSENQYRRRSKSNAFYGSESRTTISNNNATHNSPGSSLRPKVNMQARSIEELPLEDGNNCCGRCYCCCLGSLFSSCNGGTGESTRTSNSFAGSHGILCRCYIPRQSRSKIWKFLNKGKKSILWKVSTYLFSVFLLFGPALQALADVGPRGDVLFLWFRVAMLAFFVLDITLSCFLEEDYFVVKLCKRGNDWNSANFAPSRSNSGAGYGSNDSKDTLFRIGGFLFWCDVISTFSILYDLSFLNNHHFEAVVHEFSVIGGIPNPESFTGYRYNRLSLNTLEFNLIVVIFRTARCARFVKSKAAVGVSKRIDWYGSYKLLRFVNPCFYYNMWTKKREQARESVMADQGHDDLGLLGSTIGVARRRSMESDSANASRVISGSFQTEGDVLRGLNDKKQFGSALWEKLKTTRWKSEHSDSDDDLYSEKSRSMSQRSSRSGRSDIGQTHGRKSILAFSNVSRKNSGEHRPKSRFQSKSGKGHNESQVGSDMRDLTGKRIAVGTLFMLLCTVLCTYTEATSKRVKTMMVLHTQTMTAAYIEPSLTAAVNSSTPTLYEYQSALGSEPYFPNPRYLNGTNITERNKVLIRITDISSQADAASIGWFDDTESIRLEATVDIIATIFIVLFWFTGVISFSGPVMLLVITPVEQMVRLLGMLTLDPLGYQSTARYRKFLTDDEELSKNTRWTNEVLKGMETSFLKSTILRIGSLMKVGFGSAGVEIIQNNLEKGQHKNMLILNSQGTTVSCIFLFSDIRQFTDATEQLQEEVFVFTNRIAAVVHSICNSYGGAANKNVGDAFLLSWALEDEGRGSSDGHLVARRNQADKALLSVIKICIALTYDSFFLQPLSSMAQGRLKTRLKDRSGSVVQMGFGLHAGRAVQGAIGSRRKIDATYVSESVERTEFLESSTKKYGVKLLMSGQFHQLLHPRTQGRCRKVDQILIVGGEDATYQQQDLKGEFMNLFTFDMDVHAMQRYFTSRKNMYNDDDDISIASSVASFRSTRSLRRLTMGVRNRRRAFGQRGSTGSNRDLLGGGSRHGRTNDLFDEIQPNSLEPFTIKTDYNKAGLEKELLLNSQPTAYSESIWTSPDMTKLREKYASTMFFFKKYKLGLEAFYRKDWDEARRCFLDILERFSDGPTSYFLAQIERHGGVPPEDFREYGIAYG